MLFKKVTISDLLKEKYILVKHFSPGQASLQDTMSIDSSHFYAILDVKNTDIREDLWIVPHLCKFTVTEILL